MRIESAWRRRRDHGRDGMRSWNSLVYFSTEMQVITALERGLHERSVICWQMKKKNKYLTTALEDPREFKRSHGRLLRLQFYQWKGSEDTKNGLKKGSWVTSWEPDSLSLNNTFRKNWHSLDLHWSHREILSVKDTHSCWIYHFAQRIVLPLHRSVTPIHCRAIDSICRVLWGTHLGHQCLLSIIEFWNYNCSANFTKDYCDRLFL